MNVRPLQDKRLLLATVGVVLVAGVVLALAISGRGGSVEPPQATGEASPSSAEGPAASQNSSPNAPETSSLTSAPSTASTRHVPTTTQGANPLTRIVQWLNEQAPLGGGTGDPRQGAFIAMLEGDCSGVLKLSVEGSDDESVRLLEPWRTLYEGAASACLAAFEHKPGLWPRAEAALTQVMGQASRFDCQEQTVYRLFQRLVTLHLTEPDARFVKAAGGSRVVLKCPYFTTITPHHGPAEGGYPIRLEGENLPENVGINFGQRHLMARSEAGRYVVVIAPPASTPDELVCVWPDGKPSAYDPVTCFQYDPPTTSTRPTTPPTSTSKNPPPSSS